MPIKRVEPVSEIVSELPTQVQETPERGPGKSPAQPAVRELLAERYSLAKISPIQAQELLKRELLQDPKALENEDIVALRAALERRSNNQPPNGDDIAVLITASSRVASLVVDNYAIGPKQGKLEQPTSPELRKKIADFDELASSFGIAREPMRY